MNALVVTASGLSPELLVGVPEPYLVLISFKGPYINDAGKLCKIRPAETTR
jgi:hypothetical protein